MTTTNETTTIRCACCNEEFDSDTMTATSDGYVCEDCIDNEYFFCEHCEEYHHNDDCVEVAVSWRGNTEYWCEDCAYNDAYRCDNCEEYFVADIMHIDEWGNQICDHCYDDGYITCEDCGRITNDYEEIDDCYYCSSCADDRREAEADEPIHQYGYKPAPIKVSRAFERGVKLMLGIELEVDCGSNRYDTAKEITDAAEGRIYCKVDGSLRDNGFEIVTHPATLAYHLYDFRWANIMRIAKKNGYKSHDTETCGLHIHVGREEFGSSYEEREAVSRKLVVLVSVLKDEMTKFSRRKSAHLEHWAKIPALDFTGLSESAILDYAFNAVRFDRYVAVNLRNEHTVEFRLFRGTLKRDTLAASLQIVSNLCKFAMTHTAAECVNATFADIINVEPTSVLIDYCVSRGLTQRVAV